MSDPMSLALAKLDEAMRPGLGGGADPARRRCAQRLAQLARCGDEELPAFAKRHMPGREIEGSELRAARDLLLVIDGLADLDEGGSGAWAALAEVKELLERRIATAKEEAQRRKAEEEAAALDDESTVAGEAHIPAAEPHPFHALENPAPPARPAEPARTWEAPAEPARTWEPTVEPAAAAPNPIPPPVRPPSRLGSTADAPHGLPLPSLPFRATKPSEPAHAEHRPAREEPPEMTMAVRLPIREKSALPFAGPATPLPPESRPRAQEAPRLDLKRSPIAPKLPVVEDLDEPTGTEELLGATGKIRAIKGPVLPFRASLPGPEATPPSSSPAPVASSSPARAAVEEDLEEATGKVRAVKGEVLPFRPSLLGLEAASPPSSPGSPVDSTPRAQSISTGPQSAANPGSPSAQSVSTGAPSTLAAEPLKQLSISQYASLCAELTVFPEAAEGIFRRYGLDDDEKRSTVDAAWKERLRLDRAEYNQWLDLYQRYRALWKQHG